MEQLDDEVTRLAGLSPERRMAGSSIGAFTKLVELINRLVDTAESLIEPNRDASDDDSRFFVLLERAETWCDSLSDFLPPGKATALVAARSSPSTSPGSSATTSAVPLISLAHEARLRTFGAARDAYRRSAQWQLCLRYAERVDAVNRAMLQLWQSNPVPDGTVCSLQARQCAVAVTRSTLSVGGLQSKLEHHNTAFDRTRAAAAIIDPVVKELVAAADAAVANPGSVDEDSLANLKNDLAAAAALRVAAVYSTGAELEHLERSSEAQAVFEEALRAATIDTPLPSGHPLIAKIREALGAYRSGASSVVSSVANGARVGRTSTKPTSSLRKTSSRSRSKTRDTSGDIQSHAQSARKPSRKGQGVGEPLPLGRAPLAPVTRPQDPPRTADPSHSSARRPAPTQPSMPPIVVPQPPRTSTAPTGPQQGGGFRRPHGRDASSMMNGSTQSARKTGAPAKTAYAEPSLVGDGSEPVFKRQQSSPMTSSSAAAVGTGGVAAADVAHIDDSLLQGPGADPSTQFGHTSGTGGRPTPGIGSSMSTRHATPAGTRPGAKKGGSKGKGIPPVDTMKDRELELRRRYLVWVADACGPVRDMFRRRTDAAMKIQCAWRCSRARLEVFNRRQILYFFVHNVQKAAAHSILTKYRTFVAQRNARRKIHELRERRAAIAQLEHHQRRAILVIQRAMATYVKKCRREAELLRLLQLEQAAKLRQYDTAAVIVQRWWPIAKKQRAYWAQRNEELAVQRQAEAKRLRMHTAATNISRVFRGFRARRYVTEYREAERERKRRQQLAIRGSIDVIRIFLSEVRSRKKRLELEADLELKRRDIAASKIQAGWERSLQREHMRIVHRRGRLVKRSACVIQRCYRRFRARRDLRYLRTMSKMGTVMRVEKEWKQERAVRKVQCCWRQHLARARVRMVKASYGRRLLLATWTLQRLGRAYLTRCDQGLERMLKIQLYEHAVREAFRRREAMAAMLQAACRSHLSTRHALEQKMAIEAEELLIIRRTRREMFEDKHATKIQSLVRGHHGRQRASERADLIRDAEAVVLTTTVRLQCFFRKVAAIKELHRRQVVAWKARKKRELMVEVANELFASRVDELNRLEQAGRAAIMSKERARTLALVAKAERWRLPITHAIDIATATHAGPVDTPDVDLDPANRQRVAFDDVRAETERRTSLLESGGALANLEEQESRARNTLLRQEVQLFVGIFVLLQRSAPEPPLSATPPDGAGAADDEPLGAYDSGDDEPPAVAVAAEEPDVGPMTPVQCAPDGQLADDPSVAAGPSESIPRGDDLDDLLAAPPPDMAAGSRAAPRDAFDEHYDLSGDDEDGDDLPGSSDCSGVYD